MAGIPVAVSRGGTLERRRGPSSTHTLCGLDSGLREASWGAIGGPDGLGAGQGPIVD